MAFQFSVYPMVAVIGQSYGVHPGRGRSSGPVGHPGREGPGQHDRSKWQVWRPTSSRRSKEQNFVIGLEIRIGQGTEGFLLKDITPARALLAVGGPHSNAHFRKSVVALRQDVRSWDCIP